MQEKTKEMDGALTNNMEEYRTQKKAREKRLMAYAEEIQKNTLQMSSALIEELVAERKYQKKTQQDIAVLQEYCQQILRVLKTVQEYRH